MKVDSIRLYLLMLIKNIFRKMMQIKNYTVEYRIMLYRLEIDDFIPLSTGYKYNISKLIENNQNLH